MEVKRKQNESTGSLMRRFSRLAQQSKIVVRTKKRGVQKKKLTKREEKNRAIMRNRLQALRRRLERMGTYSQATFEDEKKKLKQELKF